MNKFKHNFDKSKQNQKFGMELFDMLKSSNFHSLPSKMDTTTRYLSFSTILTPKYIFPIQRNGIIQQNIKLNFKKYQKAAIVVVYRKFCPHKYKKIPRWQHSMHC